MRIVKITTGQIPPPLSFLRSTRMIYRGIDYGHGLTNIDVDTNIRYGVIHQHEVLQAWADSSSPIYPDDDNVNEYSEPIAFSYDGDGIEASQSGDDGDIFIVKSPFYTRCQFCSPCAPGAGYLMNPCDDGPKAYCFGHGWFESGRAPYPVYSVEDDSEVLCKA